MIRLLFLGLLFYLGYRLVQWVLRPRVGAPSRPSGRTGERGEEMVRDPRCGTFIPRRDALTKTVGGKTLYFCSKACRDAFDGG